jgi:hypothetical protein
MFRSICCCRNAFCATLVLSLAGGSAAFGQQPAGNWVDQRMSAAQQAHPQANLRVTGRGRTPQRQAELMYDRVQGNREDFLRTYPRNAPYVQQMDQYVQQHPNASRPEAVSQFTQYINEARQQGYRVSNHLPSADGNRVARDVSVPQGGPAVQNQVEQTFNQLGCTVLREGNAATGAHWHVDCNRNAGQQAPSRPQTLIMDDNAPRNSTPMTIAPRQNGQSAPTAALRF